MPFFSPENLFLTGKMFIDNASLVIEGSGVTASNVTVVNESLITADLVVAPNATGGNHLVRGPNQ